MASSTYHPKGHSDICERLLERAQNEDDLSKAKNQVGGLVSSVQDILKALADLISGSSVLLMDENINLPFTP
jgi:hypothetical protein